MKKLITLIFLSISILSFGQQNFDYVKIDSCNASKSELYSRAREWVAKNFNSAQSVIQMDDRESGDIIAKGIFDLGTGKGLMYATNQIRFTLTIKTKDNKFKIEINELYHNGYNEHPGYVGGYLSNDKPDCGTFYIPRGRWDDIKKAAINHCNALINIIDIALKQNSSKDDF